MQFSTAHNPDRYMVDLRQILSQGRKRVGLLIGAGAPTAVLVDSSGRAVSDGEPLIPDVSGLTETVIGSLNQSDSEVITKLKSDLGDSPNVEAILTRVRRLAQAIGSESIHGMDGKGYEGLAARICELIGDTVKAALPDGPNPYSELVSWIAGTHREHSVEIFTPNYDLLFEEAFERTHVAYFDGFTGARSPFFDPASISSSDELPTRWSRLWKLHGSLGWKVENGAVIRTGDRTATELIYPDHLKYDEVTRAPYSAMFERLRHFLATPDSLLICSGFSFFDSHICAVVDEALAGNAHTAVFAFQYRALKDEASAVQMGYNRPNLSVYARDGAVINGIAGSWQTGEPPTEDWEEIRKTFWNQKTSEFLLGDFASLARFCGHAQALQLLSETANTESPSDEESAVPTALPEGTDAES